LKKESLLRCRHHYPHFSVILVLHGAPRKTHGGGALGRLLFVIAEPHSLGGGGRQHRGRRTGTWPWGLVLAEPPLDSQAIPATEMRLRRIRGRWKPEKGIEAEGRAERLLKRFRCANDTMINNHLSPMKGRGQVHSNEEQFAFPLLICNQILYHIFLHQP
jgi:hypothetical protein